jgi:hypothetical protein
LAGAGFLAAVVLFGLLGGSVSAMLHASDTRQSARIPDLTSAIRVTFMRILMGGASALVLYVCPTSSPGGALGKQLFIDSIAKAMESLKPLTAYSVAFVAGFSERLVTRAVEKIAGSADENSKAKSTTWNRYGGVTNRPAGHTSAARDRMTRQTPTAPRRWAVRLRPDQKITLPRRGASEKYECPLPNHAVRSRVKTSMVSATTLHQVLSGLAREGEPFERLAEDRVRCYADGHRGLIPPGPRGICKVRWNEDGRLSANRS